MNTPVKILLGALGTVVVIFVAIAVAVAFVFEPNDYRPLVVDSVRDATGRDFTLDGDLELKLFPCCGVRVGSAMLGNPPGFPQTPFARIDSAAVSVKLWPLLTRREVQIGTVTLSGAEVHLTELADGRVNWSFETDETTADQPDDEAGATIASLTIEGLEIRNGTVAYSGADGASYSARDIFVDAGAIGGDAPVPVSVRLTARDEGADATAEVELTGSAALAGDRLSLDEPRLVVRASGAAIPTGQATAEVAAASLDYDTNTGAGGSRGLDAAISLPGTRIEVLGDMALNDGVATGSGEFRLVEGDIRRLLAALPDAGYVPAGANALERLTGTGRWALTETGASLSGLDLVLDGSRITGSAGLTSFETGAATARLSIDRLNMDTYLPKEDPAAAAAAAAAANEPTEVPFDALAEVHLDAALEAGELVVSGMTLRDLDATIRTDSRALSLAVESDLFGGHLKLTGSGSPAGASPTLAGRLEMTGISPRAALEALGESVETANPEVLSTLTGTAGWQLGRRSLALQEMSWQLDATRLTGSLGIDGFDAPSTRFDLALDRIDLDDYLAPETDVEASADEVDVEIPAELIRGLDLTGRLRAAALRVMDLDLTDLEAAVTARDGMLRLEPLTAKLYGGTYQGTLAIDATGPRSRLTLDQQVSAVQVGQLLDALFGSDRIAGALTLDLTGSGEGNTQTELLKGLTGNLAFSLTDGVYHGMDIAYEIENARSLLKRTAAPERPNRRETPIRALSFSGRIADGVLGSDNLNAEIPHLKLGGKGGINLVERTLDYQLSARVLKTADTASVSGLEGLGGSTIPLSITGPMADPRVRVDLQGLVVETVRDRARNELLKRLGAGQDEPTSGTGGAGAGSGTATVGSEAAPAPATTDEQGAASLNEEPAGSTEATDTEEQTSEPPTTRDLIERGLRDLLRKPKPESEGSGD